MQRKRPPLLRARRILMQNQTRRELHDHKPHGPHRPLNRETIKAIAILAMTLNHLAQALMTPGTALSTALIDVGHFTAITMIWFLCEGFDYTHDRRAYGRRLLLFGVLSQLPFSLAMSRGRSLLSSGDLNMMFSLFLCFCLLELLSYPLSRGTRAAGIAAVFLTSLFCDWFFLAPAYTLLFYWGRKECPGGGFHSASMASGCQYSDIGQQEHPGGGFGSSAGTRGLRYSASGNFLPQRQSRHPSQSSDKLLPRRLTAWLLALILQPAWDIAVGLLSAAAWRGGSAGMGSGAAGAPYHLPGLPFPGSLLLQAFFSTLPQAAAMLCILFLYNGKRAARGRSFSKWFFYVYYPAHLLAIGITARLLLH